MSEWQLHLEDELRKCQAAIKKLAEEIAARAHNESVLRTALSDARARVGVLEEALGLVIHKIEQTLEGQYPDGAGLRAALFLARQVTGKGGAL